MNWPLIFGGIGSHNVFTGLLLAYLPVHFNHSHHHYRCERLADGAAVQPEASGILLVRRTQCITGNLTHGLCLP